MQRMNAQKNITGDQMDPSIPGTEEKSQRGLRVTVEGMYLRWPSPLGRGKLPHTWQVQPVIVHFRV